MRSKIPMERFGNVDEAAALICWLASRECSFNTGAVFDLSDGRATYRDLFATRGGHRARFAKVAFRRGPQFGFFTASRPALLNAV
jgi:accessory colonization factor AcfC